MPYASVDDLPESVRDRIKSPKKRRQWLHVWNSSFERHKDEGRAFAEANATVKKAATMPDDDKAQFHFFLPIAKVDKEKRTVSGYASTECLDLDGEIVSRDALKAAIPGYWQWRNIREMHQPSAIGKAQEYNLDEKGMYLTAKIVDDAAWNKVSEGVYNGFSIGGRKLAKTGNVITKVDLVEISVVDRPANPECRFTVQKAASGETLADAILIPAAADEQPPEMIEKREFSSEARNQAASSGAAMSDGSFPIENEGDLKNAIRAIGRAKNPAKTKKHIRRRAHALGLESLLPDEWQKIAKSAPSPSVSTSGAGGRAETVGGETGSSHEPSPGGREAPLADGGFRRLSKRERKLLKGLGIAADLAHCFDRIRYAQRALMREAQVEGGDGRDKALASRLGEVARGLAAIVGQKAEHEGEEALSLTDADDRSFSSIYGDEVLAMSVDTNKEPDALTKMIVEAINKAAPGGVASGHTGNNSSGGPKQATLGLLKASRDAMKQSKKERAEIEECVKALFDMHKAAHAAHAAMVKAGKAKDDEKPMDHGEAMKMLQKAFGALINQKALGKAATDALKKAAARVSGEGTVEDGIGGLYEVPSGVKTLSPGEMASAPAAKGALITAEQADLMVKSAKLEVENELLKRMPAASGARPYAFDTAKVGLTAGQGEASPVGEFFKGANPANLVSEDQSTREAEIAKSIGEKILGGKGKSLFDPAFHGTAGAA